jgi:hypothetical protein
MVFTHAMPVATLCGMGKTGIVLAALLAGCVGARSGLDVEDAGAPGDALVAPERSIVRSYDCPAGAPMPRRTHGGLYACEATGDEWIAADDAFQAAQERLGCCLLGCCMTDPDCHQHPGQYADAEDCETLAKQQWQ